MVSLPKIVDTSVNALGLRRQDPEAITLTPLNLLQCLTGR